MTTDHFPKQCTTHRTIPRLSGPDLLYACARLEHAGEDHQWRMVIPAPGRPEPEPKAEPLVTERLLEIQVLRIKGLLLVMFNGIKDTTKRRLTWLDPYAAGARLARKLRRIQEGWPR